MLRVEGPTGFETGDASLTVSEVLSKPSLSVSPYPFLLEFDSLHLTCNTSSKLAKVVWFWNREPLRSNPQIQLSDNNRTFAIQRIVRSDAGIYQCEVSKAAFIEMSDVTYIEVIYGPDTPVIQTDETSYAEHSKLSLSCKAVAFPVEYSWFHNGKELSKGSVLRICNVTVLDSGTYTCQALNGLSHRMANATLEVEVVASE
ncbi:carcinoembryonic antigen-related cell adhesion molecule 6-like [Rhineura floridana]|uniref:carcinoembryonic antigen-related cell adhesion molecule 6-like n=1 Tax=Rhineura floridana TaxID=261503 RepID=UPI002AC80C26|nr:carcinoembryonic antigen-related cell adhesion molecule 6-like [Rhineura floridana]